MQQRASRLASRCTSFALKRDRFLRAVDGLSTFGDIKMNSPAEATRVIEADIAEGSQIGGESRDQTARSAAALRLAAEALKAHPSAGEAFAHYAAIYDKISLHDDALLAFGKVLTAHANDLARQTEALNALVHIQHFSALRLDQSTKLLDRMNQMSLLRTWSEELAAPRNADPKRLLRHGFKVYSQCDEDGIIQEIFKRIETTNRIFVEFGVETGIECNTVKLLLEGWRGLWIDGDGKNVEKISTRFKSLMDSRHLAVRQSFITAENINALISDGGLRGPIDLLSIDIDNNDYWVWKAIDVIEPRVVVIEYNATLRPPLSMVVPYNPEQTWSGSNYFGASLEALVKLGRTKGYRLVGCNFSGTNAFFVREELAKDLFLDPPTAQEHYEPPRYYFSLLKAGHRAEPQLYLNV
jgi:tetratricopeptide (TPR) repeat protein